MNKHYGLWLVWHFAQKIHSLKPAERPKIRFIDKDLDEATLPCKVEGRETLVFYNPCDRMVVLRGDEYDSQLVRKINEHRYGCCYNHASLMGSENSEDATTWSFFRTFERLWEKRFVNPLLGAASRNVKASKKWQVSSTAKPNVRFWFGRVTEEKVPVPAYLNADETFTEFDVLIESGTRYLITIEAKLTGNIRRSSARDQFIRNVDIGTLYAKQHGIPLRKYYSLLVCPAGSKDISLVLEYKNPARLAKALECRMKSTYRDEALIGREIETIAGNIGWVAWEDLIAMAGRMAAR